MDPLTQAITDTTTAVSNDQTVEQSAITLLNSMGAQILLYKNDPAALEALVAQINTNSAALAAAVAANTSTPAPASPAKA